MQAPTPSSQPNMHPLLKSLCALNGRAIDLMRKQQFYQAQEILDRCIEALDTYAQHQADADDDSMNVDEANSSCLRALRPVSTRPDASGSQQDSFLAFYAKAFDLVPQEPSSQHPQDLSLTDCNILTCALQYNQGLCCHLFSLLAAASSNAIAYTNDRQEFLEQAQMSYELAYEYLVDVSANLEYIMSGHLLELAILNNTGHLYVHVLNCPTEGVFRIGQIKDALFMFSKTRVNRHQTMMKTSRFSSDEEAYHQSLEEQELSHFLFNLAFYQNIISCEPAAAA